MPYEVLAKEYTVHRDVRVLTDNDGKVTGKQLGLGKVCFQGEVLPDDAVGSVYKDALDNEDHASHAYISKRLKKVSGEPSQNTAQRLGMPFADYGDMDEDAVLAAMKHLPSGVINAIKRYESEIGEGRDKIVNYSIGFGTDPDARQEGRVGSAVLDEGDRSVEPDEKASAKLVTRAVPGVGDDAEGDAVKHGEGYTGVGTGIKPDKSDEDEGTKKVVRARRGRRDRPSASE